jgi:periplasmic protein TonB
MMRSWIYKNARPVIAASAIISFVTHATAITAWVIGTLPAPGLPQTSIANRVFFIPPPDRIPTQPGSRQALRYVKTDAPGLGTGDGPRMMGEARPVPTNDVSAGKPTESKDTVTADPVAPTVGKDSVYSILEVDTAVVRSTSSAAPAYPLKLLQTHVEGFVSAQYTVDTTGFADTTSFQVIQATHKEFIQAVKDALPYMRFSPAKIGSTRVRQQVQQQFSFKINDSTNAPARRRPPA